LVSGNYQSPITNYLAQNAKLFLDSYLVDYTALTNQIIRLDNGQRERALSILDFRFWILDWGLDTEQS